MLRGEPVGCLAAEKSKFNLARVVVMCTHWTGWFMCCWADRLLKHLNNWYGDAIQTWHAFKITWYNDSQIGVKPAMHELTAKGSKDPEQTVHSRKIVLLQRQWSVFKSLNVTTTFVWIHHPDLLLLPICLIWSKPFLFKNCFTFSYENILPL